jgi:hypothetical protein
MSLLTICQNAADEVGITQPSSVVGNTNTEAQKLLRYANKIGNRLMKKVPWETLRTERTFTALNQEIQNEILPSTFDRFVPETFWDRTNRFLLAGPVSSTEWNSMKGSGDVSGRKFLLRGGVISIYPVPSGGQLYAFEYISNYWAQTAAGVAKEKFTLDTDTSLINEELVTQALIVAFLKSEGLPYLEAQQEYNEYFETMLENDQPSSGIMMSGDIFGGGRHFTGEPGANTGSEDGDSSGLFWNTEDGTWDE